MIPRATEGRLCASPWSRSVSRTARSSVSTATRQWLVEAEDNPFMTDDARVAALELLNKVACVSDCSALDCVASIPVK